MKRLHMLNNVRLIYAILFAYREGDNSIVTKLQPEAKP